MSLVSSQQLQDRRSWRATTVNRLYALQHARFAGMATAQKSEMWKLMWQLSRLTRGPLYATAIARTIVKIEHVAIVNQLWERLLEAETEADFARIVGETRPGTPAGDYVDLNEVDESKISRLATRIYNAYREGKLLTGWQILEEMGRYASGLASFGLYNSILRTGFHSVDDRMVNLQSVPCVLSSIPLRHVQSIEVARSGKILKFRATGSVFLANQEGGEDGIRIEGLIVRSEVIFIMFLWALFLYGQGRVKEVENYSYYFGMDLATLKTSQFDITRYNRTLTKPSYEHHWTFPLVTNHIIIPNCFIETISFEEKLELGKDVIGYTILCRTYRKPLGFDIYTSNSEMNFLSPIGNKNLSMYKVIEFGANATRRFIQANGIFIDESQRKVGIEGAESDDVYYNIDTFDFAATVALGVMGIGL